MSTERQGPDKMLTVLWIIAGVVGVLAVLDAGAPSGASLGDVARSGLQQAMWLALAIGAYFTAARVPERHWRWMGVALFGLALVSCVLVLTDLGVEINGARRWLAIPLPGRVTVQPAEVFKVSAILLLACLMAKLPQRRRKPLPRLDRAVRSAPFPLVLGGAVLIEQEPDLGTAVVVVGIFLVMLWLGGVPFRYILAVFAAGLLGVIVMIYAQPYRLERVLGHQQRWSEELAQGVGYQPLRAEVGIGLGGLTGAGIGWGVAKHSLPAATSDFIFTTIAEETGFIGSLGVLALLGSICWRLFWLAGRAPTRYGALVCAGMGSWVGMQAAFNLAMVTGVIPPVGIPLPFLSAGGSGLLALALGLGIVQSAVMTPRKEESPDETGGVRRRHGRTRIPGDSHRLRRSLSRL